MKKSNLFGLLFSFVGAILLGYGILSAATTDDSTNDKTTTSAVNDDAKSYDCPLSKLFGVGDDNGECSKKMKAHCDDKGESARDGKCDGYAKSERAKQCDGDKKSETSEKAETEGYEFE